MERTMIIFPEKVSLSIFHGSARVIIGKKNPASCRAFFSMVAVQGLEPRTLRI
jgi:hypothetical protein